MVDITQVAVAIGMGNNEQTWPLGEPQPLGGVAYPTRSWAQGAVVRSFIDIRLPAEVESGTYNLGLRLLDAANGNSLADWLLATLVASTVLVFEEVRKFTMRLIGR